MKKYVVISGFNINQANRGNAALSYGSIHFLEERGLFHKDNELVFFFPYNNFLIKKHHHIQKSHAEYNKRDIVINYVPVFIVEKFLYMKWGISFPFSIFSKIIKNVEYEAADYGGDGFSDIYGDQLFSNRLRQTEILKKARVPLIMLPMTIGPFKKETNKKKAEEIMRYASKIYVRDNNYIKELDTLSLSYERYKDLSAYMLPEAWDINIPTNSIGINVSGLALSNAFTGLEGQFDNYQLLIDNLINHFRKLGNIIYLIPHSYNYHNPEPNNDDMVACRKVYSDLGDKDNVILLDYDLTSPQVKYVISKMRFFIGTRMHANFAAIYTNVPVFGLAYSYKFIGAFNANGLDGEAQTYTINNLGKDKIDDVIKKIDSVYSQAVASR